MLPLGSLENYQLSPNNGFLPSEPPLDRLPKQYEAWEAVCSNLPGLIRDKKIYQTILQLPTISTDSLHTEPEWRRAYVILGFLLNGYLWGSGHKIDVRSSTANETPSEPSHSVSPPVSPYP